MGGKGEKEKRGGGRNNHQRPMKIHQRGFVHSGLLFTSVMRQRGEGEKKRREKKKKKKTKDNGNTQYPAKLSFTLKRESVCPSFPMRKKGQGQKKKKKERE